MSGSKDDGSSDVHEREYMGKGKDGKCRRAEETVSSRDIGK
jgi:hypothetical protein